MTDRFEIFIDIILDHEGGYVNDPDDYGGETKYGITKRRYPDLDIQNITVQQAKDIYYEDFYQDMNIKYIHSDLLALHVLDMGVNAGKRTAIRLLQELINNIPRDGILGPVTEIAVANAMITTNLVEAYKAKRVQRYYYISTLRNNKKYLAGWVNRVNKTKL